jgi:hypothetical protein
MENWACTPFWELSPEEQSSLNKILQEENDKWPNKIYGENGDYPAPDGIAPCRKCGQLRLRHNENNEHWCRRCRYTFFNEYFYPMGEDV